MMSKIRRFAGIGLSLALVTGAMATALAQDAEQGERVFRKCAACHSMEPGQHKIGPSLAGVVGKEAAEAEGFRYSDALEDSDLTWDEETLDAFLAAPTKVVPGTKMVFPGLKSPEDRAAVIAFLGARAPAAAAAPAPMSAAAEISAMPAGYVPDVKYTLRTGIAGGRMVFIGFGGDIDGVVNPQLSADEGDVVQITLINGEGARHDIVIPEHGVASQHVIDKGAATTIAFRARAVGTTPYFCSLPGHREAGMEGSFTVNAAVAEAAPAAASIVMDPAAVPAPIGEREPTRVRVELEAVELEGELADGTTYQYWTFNGTVPGPFIRVRVGDTVEVVLANDADSTMIHSVDFHAATGPGGGAAHLQVDPGDSKRVDFKALAPGIFVYHCATPMVAHHIAAGMYGLILVEPEGGLPPVDKEFYVMQGEIYTHAPFGTPGSQEFSVEALLNETPEYFVFNGAVGGLTAQRPMRAEVGETVRLFVGVGGPNFSSSFHVIGEIFDRVYDWGDVISPPARGVQTVTIPAGGAAITEFALDVPGRYILVDHALSRLERGLVGFLHAEGEPDPEIYKPYDDAVGAGH